MDSNWSGKNTSAPTFNWLIN